MTPFAPSPGDASVGLGAGRAVRLNRAGRAGEARLRLKVPGRAAVRAPVNTADMGPRGDD